MAFVLDFYVVVRIRTFCRCNYAERCSYAPGVLPSGLSRMLEASRDWLGGRVRSDGGDVTKGQCPDAGE